MVTEHVRKLETPIEEFSISFNIIDTTELAVSTALLPSLLREYNTIKYENSDERIIVRHYKDFLDRI